MKNRILITFLLIIGLTAESYGWILAVKGGRIFTMSNGIIDDGIILIENNRIAEVGKDISIPAEAEIIDASGMTVTPGLFDAFDHIGLVEISAVNSTNDIDETSEPVVPQVSVVDAFNTQSKLIPVARIEGVTTILCAPGKRDPIAGLSAIIDLNGSTVDEMTVKSPAALHINLGESPTRTWSARKKIDTRMGLMAVLRQTLIEAQEYQRKLSDYESKAKEYRENLQLPKKRQNKDLEEPYPPDRDLEKEALVKALDGTIPTIISANRKDDILAGVRLAEEFGLRMILLNGAEAYKVADVLKRKKIPVLVGPITTQPSSMETLGAIYENAALLDRAGVEFAIIAGSTFGVRDLRFQAGIAAQYGLPISSALMAITISPARILGVEKDLGSIEPDKIANIAIFDGDPLQPLTHVTGVIIEGKVIPLESFQTELYRQYK